MVAALENCLAQVTQKPHAAEITKLFHEGRGQYFLNIQLSAISLVFDQNTTGSYLFCRFQSLQSLLFICCRITTENVMTTSEKELIWSYSDHFHYSTVQTWHVTETERFE